MSPIRRAGIALALTATSLASGASFAAAATEPERYSDRRTHAGPNEARSEQRISCVGSDGEVYHERTTKRANAKGKDGRTVRHGDPAACENGRSTPTFATPGFLGGGDLNVETGEVSILSPGRD